MTIFDSNSTLITELSLRQPSEFISDVDGDLTDSRWWSEIELESANQQVNRDDNKKNNKRTLVFFMIPGNPGVIDYYTPFLGRVFEECQRGECRVVVVGGHTWDTESLSSSPNDQKLYTLKDQIGHKIKCLDKLREKFTTSEDERGPRFILCGHSIGAFICSEILRARPNHGIEQIYALHPTLQHIANTPNGKKLRLLFCERSRNLAASFIASVRWLLGPTKLKTLVWILTWQSEPALSVTADKLLSHGQILKNALRMAETEMMEVLDLDQEFYQANLEKYVFYFGKNDGWVPVEHYEDLVRRFPESKIYLCDEGTKHAFVVDHSEIIAGKVVSWIRESGLLG
ncbi:hypothetical protein G9A89_023210 [Geosiphon pyriformis]|nr:hypothetical protein G9A89_023210 [Geosiphon pyriformis]